MPVIWTRQEECSTWQQQPWADRPHCWQSVETAEILILHRPLLNSSIQTTTRGLWCQTHWGRAEPILQQWLSCKIWCAQLEKVKTASQESSKFDFQFTSIRYCLPWQYLPSTTSLAPSKFAKINFFLSEQRVLLTLKVLLDYLWNMINIPSIHPKGKKACWFYQFNAKHSQKGPSPKRRFFPFVQPPFYLLWSITSFLSFRPKSKKIPFFTDLHVALVKFCFGLLLTQFWFQRSSQ